MKLHTPQPQTDIAERMAQECLVGRVRLLNRTLTGIYDDALRPIGLTSGQLNVLVVLAKRGPVSPAAVALRLNMDKSTVSRNIERMRARGWLTASSNELAISAEGRRTLARALPAWRDAQKRTRALLGRRGSQSLRRAADSVWASAGNA